MTLDEKALKTIQHYGVLPQLKYFQSEVFELNEAIIKLENGTGSIGDVIEELGDVGFMLRQFIEYYEIVKKRIEEVEEFKADRQLERIQNEFSNKK